MIFSKRKFHCILSSVIFSQIKYFTFSFLKFFKEQEFLHKHTDKFVLVTEGYDMEKKIAILKLEF